MPLQFKIDVLAALKEKGITTYMIRKEKIQAFAQENGETVNGFINRLIAQAMGVDKTTNVPENF